MRITRIGSFVNRKTANSAACLSICLLAFPLIFFCLRRDIPELRKRSQPFPGAVCDLALVTRSRSGIDRIHEALGTATTDSITADGISEMFSGPETEADPQPRMSAHGGASNLFRMLTRAVNQDWPNH